MSLVWLNPGRADRMRIGPCSPNRSILFWWLLFLVFPGMGNPRNSNHQKRSGQFLFLGQWKGELVNRFVKSTSAGWFLLPDFQTTRAHNTARAPTARTTAHPTRRQGWPFPRSRFPRSPRGGTPSRTWPGWSSFGSRSPEPAGWHGLYLERVALPRRPFTLGGPQR